MATIIAVHGTFANASPESPPGQPAPEPQWWEDKSVFERDMHDLVQSTDGKLDVVSFPWNGFNSEVDRREAGTRLVEKFQELEARNEPYCVIGHSHGGSVVSAALLASASRKRPLANLKRWITIGTPFVTMKKERLLLTRLSLIRKVILVASLMLFLMFGVYLVATFLNGDRVVFGRTFPRIFLITGLMTVVPALFIYGLFSYLDARSLHLYHRRIARRARESFGGRWLSLAHPDDEAIQGLMLLPDAKLSFFDRSFAVSTITLISVVVLPLLYLLVLTSAPAMVSLADWLKTTVYDSRVSPAAEAALEDLQAELAATRKSQGEAVNLDNTRIAAPVPDRRVAWQQYRAKRKAFEAEYPHVDVDVIERGFRFKRRFFEKDGQPCDGGKLCGSGKDMAVNSGLLLHLVTDEVSWALGASDWGGSRRSGWLLSLAVPVLLVPLVFGLLALALMIVIKGIANIVSSVASDFLNRITNAEVKRAAFGNDTEGEIATGAIDRPSWLPASPPRLPAPLADLITAYSNGIASQSLAKFRRAIGQIASAEPKHTADTAISTYFTWKELVHSSYFDVPQFRKMVAQAVSRAEGFAPTARFRADPDFARTAQWLSEIEAAPRQETPDTGPPNAKDKESVSAVVASTVKAEP